MKYINVLIFLSAAMRAAAQHPPGGGGYVGGDGSPEEDDVPDGGDTARTPVQNLPRSIPLSRFVWIRQT